jgi:hypothetical protein
MRMRSPLVCLDHVRMAEYKRWSLPGVSRLSRPTAGRLQVISTFVTVDAANRSPTTGRDIAFLYIYLRLRVCCLHPILVSRGNQPPSHSTNRSITNLTWMPGSQFVAPRSTSVHHRLFISKGKQRSFPGTIVVPQWISGVG